MGDDGIDLESRLYPVVDGGISEASMFISICELRAPSMRLRRDWCEYFANKVLTFTFNLHRGRLALYCAHR